MPSPLFTDLERRSLPAPLTPRLLPLTSRQCGVALVIILSFIVLLTGLIIAFFSRAISERQASNSSASQTKAEIFAQGATDQVIADLKTEIAAGSTVTSPAAGVNIYTPKVPATAVPALTGSSGANGLENLVKRSTYNQAWYAGANYDTTTYPAPNRAANVSTTAASQNGRLISPARWNKALLLPTDPAKNTSSTTTDLTPKLAAGTFSAPDWILIGRDGSNPTSVTPNASAANYAVGRYAYNIYDEGGLLDANVAGSPVNTTTALPLSTIAPYKNALAYADLSQLPGFCNSTSATKLSAADTAKVINAIVGWRNYASAGPMTGNFPNYTAFGPAVSPSVFTPFDLSILGNTSGFLKTANTSLSNSQTDHAFTSRQQLIQLLQSIGTTVNTFTPALQQQTLQYLTHFSRGLNQPSFTPGPTRPKVVPSSAGGNSAYQTPAIDDLINPSFLTVRVNNAFTKNDGSSAVVGDPLVKKRFALNRLAWLTYLGPISDGSGFLGGSTVNSNPAVQAVADLLHNAYGMSYSFLQQGTALNIKKYFGLSWQEDTVTVPTTDAGYNQFKWSYNSHQWGSGGTGIKGAIMKLGDIANLATSSKQHEPDFFELLKAGISVGALGKASSTAAAGSPVQIWQYNRDIDIDAHLIQIAANIIDQYDLDGFPTRIVFDNGLGPLEFRGVENLPYLYRVRYTYFKARMSVPDTSWYYSGMKVASGDGFYVASSGVSADAHNWGTNTGGTIIERPDTSGVNPGTGNPPLLSNTGLVLSMAIPDIWNPHDQNATRGAVDASSNPLYPTQFRVVAQSCPPGGTPSTFSTTISRGGSTANFVSTNTKLDTTLSFGLYTDGNNGWGTHARRITTSNSGLYFTVPKTNNGLFREPTALFKVGVPVGSQLSGLDPTGNGEDNALIHARKPSDPEPFTNDDGNIDTFASGSGAADGLLADPNMANGYGYNPNKEPVANGKYLGFYFGGAPLASRVTANANNAPNTQNRDWQTARQITGGPTNLTYLMQCLVNGKWVTYDEKYSPWGIGNMFNQWVQDGSSFPFGAMPGGGAHNANLYSRWLDPRTSRFGPLADDRAPPFNYSNSYPACLAPGSVNSPSPWPIGVSLGVLDQANWVFIPARPDFEGGKAPASPGGIYYSTAGGWYPSSGTFQPDLFSQNRLDVFSDNRAVATDTNTPPTPLAGQFYADPDGIVRRGMGAYALPTTSRPASNPPTGVPQALGGTVTGGTSSPSSQSQSRPFILNRPFRSVMELGSTFSATPWKTLDFFTPESGYSALLDVFSISDTDDTAAVVAGKVNVNTKQASVVQTILNGGYKDETNSYSPSPSGYTPLAPLTTTDAQGVAAALLQRTKVGGTTISSTTSAPLRNIAGLVGEWASSTTISSSQPNGVNSNTSSPNNIDGAKSYDGLAKDLDFVTFSSNGSFTTSIQRFREASIRPLANAGQARVWNLLVDLVVQTGRYPSYAASLEKFTADSEQRIWVHLAIDRQTGQIIDKQVETVKE